MKTIDVRPPMPRPAPGALRWVQNVDGVLKRISLQVEQGVNVVILFPI